MDLLRHELEVQADPETLRLRDSIKRAEDVTYSPSGNRVCVVDLYGNCLFVFNVERNGDTIQLSGGARITGTEIRGPHGVVWLDEERVIVGNRGAGVTFHSIPRDAKGEITLHSSLSLYENDGQLVTTPGSLFYRKIDDTYGELFSCNNFSDMISCHLVEKVDGEYSVSNHRVLLNEGLNTPDGLCLSPDEKFFFVSDHFSKQILIYTLSAELPVCVGSIGNCGYPHGLGYHSGSDALFSAGAGDRNVYVTKIGAGGWQAELTPTYQFETMTEAEFEVTHINPEDGGAKGISICPEEKTLAVSGMARPLAFYDVASIFIAAGIEIKPKRESGPKGSLIEVIQRSNKLADATIAKNMALYLEAKACLEERTAELTAMQNSESMRLTLPLRAFGNWIRKLKG